jgi:hypothetical protein
MKLIPSGIFYKNFRQKKDLMGGEPRSKTETISTFSEKIRLGAFEKTEE